MNILIPGRHHLLTEFQLDYLNLILNSQSGQIKDVYGKPIELKEKIDSIIWVVTSSNHSNTRRNPLPAHCREAMIENLSRDLPAKSYVYHIDNLGSTEKFAEYIIKKIEVDSLGQFRITPENTIVACSTPSVIDMYVKLGYRILPNELESLNPEKYLATRPWELVERIAQVAREGKDWRQDSEFVTKVSESTKALYLKYNYGDLIAELFQDPLLGDDSDLTETRDYNTYIRAFDDGAERKYALVKNMIQPGRIVDIGCCTGSILKKIGEDDRFHESDLYGIEASRKLFSLCQQRKENGEFKNNNVFFYQRNIVRSKIFADNSINTSTAFALTHEIESYAGRDALLKFLRMVHEQLAIGGVFINVDVVGPEDGNSTIYMKLRRDDGIDDSGLLEDEKDNAKLKEYLNSLSTFGRFVRFAKDFRKDSEDRIEYSIENVDGQDYVALKLKDAAEFLSKKDYTDNWLSELHEKFCFWSFSDWKKNVEDLGFKVSDSSGPFSNDWIIENRYKGKVELFTKSDNSLTPINFPPTNMILLAEKR